MFSKCVYIYVFSSYGVVVVATTKYGRWSWGVLKSGGDELIMGAVDAV